MELILSKPKEQIVDLLRYHKYLVPYLKSEAKYNDKIWVITKVLPKQLLVQWAVACARSVEHIYNEKYPSDKRVTELLDFMETISDYENINSEVKAKLLKLRDAVNAAYITANSAANIAATYAAYAAYAAATYAAANIAANAAYAAASAASAADADYSAEQAGGDAARKKQQELNIELCLKVISAIN